MTPATSCGACMLLDSPLSAGESLAESLLPDISTCKRLLSDLLSDSIAALGSASTSANKGANGKYSSSLGGVGAEGVMEGVEGHGGAGTTSSGPYEVREGTVVDNFSAISLNLLSSI